MPGGRPARFILADPVAALAEEATQVTLVDDRPVAIAIVAAVIVIAAFAVVPTVIAIATLVVVATLAVTIVIITTLAVALLTTLASFTGLLLLFLLLLARRGLALFLPLALATATAGIVGRLGQRRAGCQQQCQAGCGQGRAQIDSLAHENLRFHVWMTLA